jgi:hypothetical protein
MTLDPFTLGYHARRAIQWLRGSELSEAWLDALHPTNHDHEWRSADGTFQAFIKVFSR